MGSGPSRDTAPPAHRSTQDEPTRLARRLPQADQAPASHEAVWQSGTHPDVSASDVRRIDEDADGLERDFALGTTVVEVKAVALADASTQLSAPATHSPIDSTDIAPSSTVGTNALIEHGNGGGDGDGFDAATVVSSGVFGRAAVGSVLPIGVGVRVGAGDADDTVPVVIEGAATDGSSSVTRARARSPLKQMAIVFSIALGLSLIIAALWWHR
jgi:hypothetical protein